MPELTEAARAALDELQWALAEWFGRSHVLDGTTTPDYPDRLWLTLSADPDDTHGGFRSLVYAPAARRLAQLLREDLEHLTTGSPQQE